jgi:tetratricopeptide (TPR) repeat protein
MEGKVGAVEVYHALSFSTSAQFKDEAVAALEESGYVVTGIHDFSFDDAETSLLMYRHPEPFKKGTFFFYNDSAITNCHVVDRGAIYLKWKDQEHLAALKNADYRNDLCELTLSEEVEKQRFTRQDIKPFDELRVGDRVFSIGNPRGLAHTFSDGMISALRSSPVTRDVQLTVPSSPGSSGGPVFDATGELVGVLTYQVRDGQNLNFARSAEHLYELPAIGSRTKEQVREAQNLLFSLIDTRRYWRLSDQAKLDLSRSIDGLLNPYLDISGSPQALALKAWSQALAGNVHAAVHDLESSIQSGPWFNADLQRLLFDLQEIAWIDEQMNSLGPDGTRLGWESAIKLAEFGQRYRQIDRFDIDLNARVAENLLDLDRPNEALRVLSDSDRINPQYAESLLVYGLIYASQAEWSKSFRACKKATDEAPSYVRAWICFSNAAEELNDANAAALAAQKIDELGF